MVENESIDAVKFCIFCRIANGAEPSWKVYEDEHAYAFLDRGAATVGHTLVIPRNHAVDLFEVTREDAGRLMESVREVARLLDARLKPDGMTLFQANKTAGWQDVLHMHMHVVPRYDNDRLVRPWEGGTPTDEELDNVLARIEN